MTPTRPENALNTLTFDNRFVRELPGDPEPANFRRQVTGACYSRVLPTPAAAPKQVAVSPDAAALLDLDETAWQSDLFTWVFSGNRLLDGMDPFAMCYGGHQFGNWAGQLGDGRALSLTLTGESVERDMFYDGHPEEEPGAVVCRLSPSFIRFGNFQIHGARGEMDLLRQLTDYTIHTDFPHLGDPGKDTYIRWFQEVCDRTRTLVIHWMRVGFVHGVMNTDNMSILGLTIDYGPYGWLEDYNPVWTPNTTDARGRRYCFQNQGQIALWNLAQLADTVYLLIHDALPLKQTLADFSTNTRHPVPGPVKDALYQPGREMYAAKRPEWARNRPGCSMLSCSS